MCLVLTILSLVLHHPCQANSYCVTVRPARNQPCFYLIWKLQTTDNMVLNATLSHLYRMCQTRRKTTLGGCTYLRIVFVAVCISFYFTLSLENYPSKLFLILLNLDSFFAKRIFSSKCLHISYWQHCQHYSFFRCNYLSFLTSCGCFLYKNSLKSIIPPYFNNNINSPT